MTLSVDPFRSCLGLRTTLIAYSLFRVAVLALTISREKLASRISGRTKIRPILSPLEIPDIVALLVIDETGLKEGGDW